GRLVPECGNAAARAADHSIRNQQTAVRHTDGNQEGQDEGAETCDRGGIGRSGGPVDRDDPHLYARSRQTGSNLRGRSEGGRGQAGGKAEIRGARSMSILVVAEQRGGAWNRTSWETVAAAQQIGAELGQPVEAAVLGK